MGLPYAVIKIIMYYTVIKIIKNYTVVNILIYYTVIKIIRQHTPETNFRADFSYSYGGMTTKTAALEGFRRDIAIAASLAASTFLIGKENQVPR